MQHFLQRQKVTGHPRAEQEQEEVKIHFKGGVLGELDLFSLQWASKASSSLLAVSRLAYIEQLM